MPKRKIQHSMNRRAKDHDYRSRSIYMITCMKSPEAPAFSSVEGDCRIPDCYSGAPYVNLSELGYVISRIVSEVNKINPNFQLLGQVVMPDHIHFILFVKERIEKKLGNYIAILKRNITQELWLLYPDLKGKGIACFQESFNDRILLKNGQLEIMKKYVKDNPRRLLVKRMYPEFFQRIQGIEIGDMKLDFYGNPFLMIKDLKMQVWVRSAWSEEKFEEEKEEWLENVDNGAVLVSPFISMREKKVRDAALLKGGSLILVRKERFPARYKPSGKLFELCKEGRLLMIADHNAEEYSPNLARKEAVNLNKLAEKISKITIEPLVIKASR